MTSEELKERGRDLLNTCFGNLNEDANATYLAQYWIDLFPHELENVRQRALNDQNLLEIPESPIMILPLGTSLEPLILAIHLVCPEQLFVLYTDEDLLNRLENGLLDTGSPITPMGIPVGMHATSASVFKALRGKTGSSTQKNLPSLTKVLEDPEERKQIVFDITGAKKTISGGCLLFAAYYDLPVYYMDFGDELGDYHPDLGRPLPGACYYTRQKNPIAGFCLKDIEGIKKHFDNGNYATAGELLKKTALPKMDPEYFSQDEISHFKRLYEKAQIYSDWVNGWWGDVCRNISSLPSANQTNAKLLSAYPSKTGWNESVYQTDFYDNSDGFLTYLAMELATLSRASKNGTMNPRPVFLRIYGLEELLVGFMTYRLVTENKIAAEITYGSLEYPYKKIFDAPQYRRLERLLLFRKKIKRQGRISCRSPEKRAGHRPPQVQGQGRLRGERDLFREKRFRAS